MRADNGQSKAPYGDEDLLQGNEHLKPAWQAVAVTVLMIAASVLVLALAG